MASVHRYVGLGGICEQLRMGSGEVHGGAEKGIADGIDFRDEEVHPPSEL